MADTDSEQTGGAPATQPPNEDQQNVVSRVGNLPLVSSACGVVSSAYSSTKDSMPLLKGVMDAAESGVRTLGAAATTGSKPLLDMLEPQISAVNDYAMMGMDKMEENLPILKQPADKVVSDTVGMLTGAKDAVAGAVMGAWMSGMGMSWAAVSGSINSVLGTRVGQMVSSGVGMALSRSEDWVDQNLPLSERELAAVAEPVTSEEVIGTPPSSPSYFVRLGKLSAKVQERAREQSLVRARHARDTSYSAISQITSTLDLLESARTSLGTAGNQIGGAPEQLLQLWTEWKQRQPGDGQAEADGPKDEKEQLEWRALSMVHGLSDQIRAACSGVVSSAQGLPGAVQDQLASARRSAEELHSSLGNTSTITPLLLEQSRQHLTQVQQSLDGVMEYLLNNTPLNWLVGPFAPMLTEKEVEEQAGVKTDPPK